MIRKFLFWLKVKKFQKWEPIEYGDISKFKYWSEKITVDGIKDKKITIPIFGRKWTGIVILQPLGYSNTSFNIGYSSNKKIEISNAERKIKDGAFMMRITEDPCSFFVTSNNSGVSLAFIGYGNLKTKLTLY